MDTGEQEEKELETLSISSLNALEYCPRRFYYECALGEFLCFLDRKQRLLLEARLLEEMNPQEDTVRIYGLCGACPSKVEVLGRGEVPHEDRMYLL